MEDESMSLDDIIAELIAEQVEILKTLPIGSEEWRAVQNSIADLYKLRIEASKVEQEAILEELKAKRGRKAHTADLALNGALGAAGIAAPALIFIYCFVNGLKFEETGAITSSMMKLLMKFPKPNRLG